MSQRFSLVPHMQDFFLLLTKPNEWKIALSVRGMKCYPILIDLSNRFFVRMILLNLCVKQIADRYAVLQCIFKKCLVVVVRLD